MNGHDSCLSVARLMPAVACVRMVSVNAGKSDFDEFLGDKESFWRINFRVNHCKMMTLRMFLAA
jgi:hypothetical protein